MTDTNTHDDANEGIAGLREAARQGEHAKKEAAELKRQLMFAKAGIDIETKLGKMLYRTWEGDDLELLKAEAIEIGLLNATGAAAAAAPDPARTAEDAARLSAQDALAGGYAAGAAEDLGEHPTDKALKGYHVAVRGGMQEDEARIDAMAQVLGAAAAGDKRVFFDQAKHTALAEEADRMSGRRRV